jgi:hypothetical protein
MDTMYPNWPYDNVVTILHNVKGIRIRCNVEKQCWELSVAAEIPFPDRRSAEDYYYGAYDSMTGELKKS